MKDLKQKKENSASTSDNFPIPFCVIDKKGVITKANGSLLDLTGYERNELIDRGFQDLTLEKRKIKEFLSRLKKKPKRKEGFTVLTASKGTVIVEISTNLWKGGEPEEGYCFAFTVIEDRIKKKRELKNKLEEKTRQLEKKSEQMADSRRALLNILEDVDESYKKAERERAKTSAIIENLIDGMLFFDSELNLTIANPKIEEFFGVSEENLTGKKPEELLSVEEIAPLLELIKNGEELKELHREQLQMEEEFYLEVTTTKVEKDEKEIGTVVHVHDISREKRIERIKSEFVSVAAHQLRTPLSGIKWTLETLLEEVDEEGRLTEDGTNLIEKAYNSNERMIRLVDDLLNVSRIEEGRYVYEAEEMNLAKALEPVIREYENAIKEKENLEFRLNVSEDNLPKVKMDEEKIGIVVQNFLDNAIKYTEEGEILLSITQPEENQIRVSVKDEGVGIPEEEQERLFNKFFRADNVMRKDVEGSGLGLFISKNIVEAHQGEIGFESTKGEGSIFYFTLPTDKGMKEN